MIKEKADTEEPSFRRFKIKKTQKYFFRRKAGLIREKALPIFALLFVILIVAPIALNKYYSYLLSPALKDSSSQIFVIKPGQPVTQIAQNLQKKGLIKNALAFRLLVAQTGIASNIQAGDFRISPDLGSHEIAKLLTHGAIDVWITFPEGTRVEEMGQIVENKLKTNDNDKYQFDKKEFIKLAKEGYMFPDTYLIARDATAQDIASRLLQTFGKKADQNLFVSPSDNLSANDIVIMASLIEREAKTNEERPVIAGILVNRLKTGIALQIDATVQYAKGYDSAKNSWWPQVSKDDYSINSPYNTYLNPGLPPAPIANPGIESLRGAANPAQTDYLYYIHDVKGKIHYARTLEEHERNIKNFL